MVHLPRPEGPLPEDFAPTRRGLAGLLFAGYALAGASAEAEPITTPTDGLFAREVEIPSFDGFRLPAYVAMPAKARRRPVVMVVSEVFGLHEYIRDVCRRLAKAGYVAIAPAFFVRAGDPAPIQDFAKVREIVAKASNAQVLGDIDATLDWLEDQPDLGPGAPKRYADMRKVGITGFCWGGAVTWMAAAHDSRIKAGVAWYGRLTKPAAGQFLGDEDRPWPIDVADDLNGPVLGLYAGEDAGIPLADVEKMRAALKASGDRKSEIVVYLKAKHGFHADYRAAYDKAAAEDGWARLLAWFKRYL
ncbi:MAG TPA: dienelactone hydrolase family protein [Caulobacteraceae bacterium]|nr:dienelactone hydrolase family protein [Caulobacteraceae bacterium]